MVELDKKTKQEFGQMIFSKPISARIHHWKADEWVRYRSVDFRNFTNGRPTEFFYFKRHIECVDQFEHRTQGCCDVSIRPNDYINNYKNKK